MWLIDFVPYWTFLSVGDDDAGIVSRYRSFTQFVQHFCSEHHAGRGVHVVSKICFHYCFNYCIFICQSGSPWTGRHGVPSGLFGCRRHQIPPFRREWAARKPRRESHPGARDWLCQVLELSTACAKASISGRTVQESRLCVLPILQRDKLMVYYASMPRVGIAADCSGGRPLENDCFRW